MKFARIGDAYLKHFWNWLELIEIVSAASSVVMFVQKEKYTSEFVRKVRSNPFETSSADYLVLWSDLEVALLSFVIFIVTIKLLRIIRFNRHICQMMATLKRSAGALVSFSAVFITAVMGFSHLGHLVFGYDLEAYSTYPSTLGSMLIMTLGGRLYYSEVFLIAEVFGPIFLFAYLLTVGMILVNIFVTLLMEAYSRVREEKSEVDFTDADLGDFMADHIHKEFKNLGKKLSFPLPAQWRPGPGKRKAPGLVRRKNVQRQELASRFEEITDATAVRNDCNSDWLRSRTQSTDGSSVGSQATSSTFRDILLLYAEEDVYDDIALSDIHRTLKSCGPDCR